MHPDHRGLDAFHGHAQASQAGQAERVLGLPVSGRLGQLPEVAVINLERDTEAVARIGEEGRAEVVDDPDAALPGEFPGTRHVGHVVFDTHVVIAIARQQPTLAPLAPLLRREELEHHSTQGHQAGLRLIRWPGPPGG